MRASHYEHYNPNPRGIHKAGDCVIRAFCKALDKDWYEVYDIATKVGRDNCMPFTCKELIPELMKEFGFIKVRISALKKGEKSITPEKFCEEHRTGTFILSMAHHLICAKDGAYWDLTPGVANKRVYSYWEKVK